MLGMELLVLLAIILPAALIAVDDVSPDPVSANDTDDDHPDQAMPRIEPPDMQVIDLTEDTASLNGALQTGPDDAIEDDEMIAALSRMDTAPGDGWQEAPLGPAGGSETDAQDGSAGADTFYIDREFMTDGGVDAGNQVAGDDADMAGILPGPAQGGGTVIADFDEAEDILVVQAPDDAPMTVVDQTVQDGSLTVSFSNGSSFVLVGVTAPIKPDSVVFVDA